MEEVEIMNMINGIWKYLISREDWEINQQYVGFKALFIGIVMKAWKEINFKTMQYSLKSSRCNTKQLYFVLFCALQNFFVFM